MASKSLNRIVNNLSWSLGDKVLDIAMRLVGGVLVARYLGVELFGQLQFSLAILALLVPVVSLGLRSIVVKHIALQPSHKGQVMGSAFIMQLLSSILTCAGLLLFVYLVSLDDGEANLAISILTITLFFHCLDPIIYWNQSQLTSQYTVWAKRIGATVGLCLKLLFIYFSVEFIIFIWVWVIESIISSILLIHFYLKKESFSDWKYDKGTAIILLKDSWPLLFSGIASIIYLKIDIVMLGTMLEKKEVGLYAAAVRISEIFYFIPTMISATVLPAIVRSSQKGGSEIAQRIQALSDALSLYSIISVAFLFFSANFLIDILFGPEFSGAVLILQIHAFALFFISAGASVNKMLIAENRTVFIMISTILGTVINVSMNLYLIPRYAGVGAAVATVISYAFSSYIACLFWKPANKHFKMVTASFFVFARPQSLFRFLMSLKQSN